MSAPINRLDLYASPVNQELVNRSIGFRITRILDVGAGSGNNIRALRKLHPPAHISALTCSPLEAEYLKRVADMTVLADLNQLTTDASWEALGLEAGSFDLILLSHVLEHLAEPHQLLSRVSSLLSPGGLILIALPNICHWRTRLQISRGSFQYQDSGILDRSHLRFFTYWSARELVETCRP